MAQLPDNSAAYSSPLSTSRPSPPIPNHAVPQDLADLKLHTWYEPGAPGHFELLAQRTAYDYQNRGTNLADRHPLHFTSNDDLTRSQVSPMDFEVGLADAVLDHNTVRSQFHIYQIANLVLSNVNHRDHPFPVIYWLRSILDHAGPLGDRLRAAETGSLEPGHTRMQRIRNWERFLDHIPGPQLVIPSPTPAQLFAQLRQRLVSAQQPLPEVLVISSNDIDRAIVELISQTTPVVDQDAIYELVNRLTGFFDRGRQDSQETVRRLRALVTNGNLNIATMSQVGPGKTRALRVLNGAPTLD